jgi:hypothetical protein
VKEILQHSKGFNNINSYMIPFLITISGAVIFLIMLLKRENNPPLSHFANLRKHDTLFNYNKV